MLDKEYKYYLQNKQDLIRKHKGQFLIIKGESVMGVYGTKEEAYEDAVKRFQLGTFLIQECTDQKEQTVQTFHSRVSFS